MMRIFYGTLAETWWEYREKFIWWEYFMGKKQTMEISAPIRIYILLLLFPGIWWEYHELVQLFGPPVAKSTVCPVQASDDQFPEAPGGISENISRKKR